MSDDLKERLRIVSVLIGAVPDKWQVELTMDGEKFAFLRAGDFRQVAQFAALIEQLEAQVDTLQTAMTAPTQDEIDLRSKLASSQAEALAAHAEVIRNQDELGKLLYYAEAQLAAAREALDDSQSLLVMVDHIGADSSMWIREDLRDLLTDQITSNRAALATAPATDGGDNEDHR